MDGRCPSWTAVEGGRGWRSKDEARAWMGGRALLVLGSEIRVREGAPKAWAKEGRDWGGWVAMEGDELARGGEGGGGGGGSGACGGGGG